MEQNKLNDGGWSPYVAGGLSGLVIIVSVLWTGQFFGASTSFVRSVGMMEKLILLILLVEWKTGVQKC